MAAHRFALPSDESASTATKTRRPPRLKNDPDRYLWGQWGSWVVMCPDPDPERKGKRHYVGSFASKWEARRARDEFLSGKRPAHPKGVRKVHTRGGIAFTAAPVVNGVKTPMRVTFDCVRLAAEHLRATGSTAVRRA